MVNKKISELDPATTITGTEVIPLVQAGTTVAATVQQLLALIVAGAPGNLDTFFETATQLGLDETTVTTLQALVASKADAATVSATYLPIGDGRSFGLYRPENYGAVGNGSADDTTALNACFAAAAAVKGRVELAGVTYKTTAALTYTSSVVRIQGAGAGGTIIAATDNTYDLLTVGDGTGNQVRPTGYLRGLSIRGPSAAPTSGKAALKVNGLNQFQIEDAHLDNQDIGLDFINNCYGSQAANLRAGFGGTCNVGVNLRTGSQSGSDIAFFNPWVGGRIAGFSCSGGGRGWHLYGGQVTAGQGTSSVNDLAGAIILGKDYLDGSTGETSVDIHGTSFEGTMYAWVFRGYDESVLSTFGCYFNPAVPSTPAIGLYKNSQHKRSMWTTVGATIGGYWSNPQLMVVSGSTAAGYVWLHEHSTYPAAQVPTTINGAAMPGSSIAFQAGLQGVAYVTDFISGPALTGLRLRNSSGVLQQSTDNATTWTNVSSYTDRAAQAAYEALSGTATNPVTSASAARPTGLTKVFWQCSTQPTNWVAGDEWINNS